MGTGKCDKEKGQGEKKQGRIKSGKWELKLGNQRKKMGNEKMWLIKEMKKMGNAEKGDWSWEKKWIYRVIIISCTSSNYRSC